MAARVGYSAVTMSFVRVVRYFEGMLGRRRISLEGLAERAKVHVVGSLISPRSVPSPMSPVSACMLTWALLHRYPNYRRSNEGQPEDAFREFASDTIAGELLIETPHGTLYIPREAQRDVGYATPIDRNPQPLLTRPPAALAAALQADTEKREVYYGERFLVTGDQVAVKGTVEPARSGAGPYRGTKAPGDFLLVPDAEVVKIREVS